ncbi:RDS/peripherin-like protein xRDS35 isoform X2 [Watersipora subatra]
MGVLMVVFGISLLSLLGPYTSILEGYKNEPFMIVYVTCGLGQMIANLVATQQFKKESRSRTRSEGSQGAQRLFQIWICVTVVSVVLVVVSGVTVGVQLNKLDDALEEGLGGVMSMYADGAMSKQTMDNIQIDFQCCGSTGPEDWFTIMWKKQEYLREESLARMKTSVYHVTDVPFSCCDPESPVTPCQHEDINNIATHSAVFDTLNEDGCKVAMLDYFKQAILLPAAVFLTCIIVLQLIHLTVMRFLETSIDNLEWASPDDEDGIAPSYLISVAD